jgi:hypothetical protein
MRIEKATKIMRAILTRGRASACKQFGRNICMLALRTVRAWLRTRAADRKDAQGMFVLVYTNSFFGRGAIKCNVRGATYAIEQETRL